jgi:hypothetical protein
VLILENKVPVGVEPIKRALIPITDSIEIHDVVLPDG